MVIKRVLAILMRLGWIKFNCLIWQIQISLILIIKDENLLRLNPLDTLMEELVVVVEQEVIMISLKIRKLNCLLKS